MGSVEHDKAAVLINNEKCYSRKTVINRSYRNLEYSVSESRRYDGICMLCDPSTVLENIRQVGLTTSVSRNVSSDVYVVE